jgi:hypothetical protein
VHSTGVHSTGMQWEGHLTGYRKETLKLFVHFLGRPWWMLKDYFLGCSATIE